MAQKAAIQKAELAVANNDDEDVGYHVFPLV